MIAFGLLLAFALVVTVIAIVQFVRADPPPPRESLDELGSEQFPWLPYI